jgi:hypothetical protein
VIAEVVLHLGRYWLIVRGVYVVMETDPCRDPEYDGRVWTEQSLRQAATDINSGRFGSFAERWHMKERGKEDA